MSPDIHIPGDILGHAKSLHSTLMEKVKELDL